MTSEGTATGAPTEAFVWTWLPGTTEPVVAGRLSAAGRELVFNYGRSYLERANAIPIYLPELPLQPGVLPLPAGLSMPSSIRDASPDAWGRRVIINRLAGGKRSDIDGVDLSELTYMLQSGSDRIGALDFQASASRYVARDPEAASLAELLGASELVERGVPLTPELDRALRHGSSLGGARPKAMIADGLNKYVAKFSAQNDTYSVVKAEYVAMRLANHAGLAVAPVRLVRAAGKDVLLVERFDRQAASTGWLRRPMVSALTLLALDEMMARYASYEDLATIIRHRFTAPRATLHELFGRLVFNVLCGNTDDHARNHAAFWDGNQLTLTPAYDICPQGRSGNEASQAMLIAGGDNLSQLAVCIRAAAAFQLSKAEAIALMLRQITAIRDHWAAVTTEAGLSEVDRRLLWRRQFLNSYAFVGAPAEFEAAAA